MAGRRWRSPCRQSPSLAALLGAVALRTTGIAFAMVTLAFAQVGWITGEPRPRRPHRRRGGPAAGQPAPARRRSSASPTPSTCTGWRWGSCVVVVVVVHSIDRAPLGRVLTGLRDDERRIAVVGPSPYRLKLFTFTVAGAWPALGGAIYALVVGGAIPHLASADLTLSLIVMVVLGGAGTRWGALVGGVVYAYLDQRLTQVGGGLPGPFGQPLFILGTLFVLAVFFARGGLSGLARRFAPGRRAVLG